MTTKFQKILDKAIEHSTPPRSFDPNATLTICGYPVENILKSIALQNKIFNMLYPLKHTAAGIRTISIEDIRSR